MSNASIVPRLPPQTSVSHGGGERSERRASGVGGVRRFRNFRAKSSAGRRLRGGGGVRRYRNLRAKFGAGRGTSGMFH